MEFDDRPETAIRLERARQARGFKTAKDAARFFGWSYETYIQHEQGIRGLSRAAKRYADAFKVGEGWLLAGEGRGPAADDEDEFRETVPLKGYVGAGAAAHFYGDADSELERVPAPKKSSKHTVAVEIRGESLGRLFDSWLVYYDEVRSPVTQDMIGVLCVVGLNDDRVLVKRIKRARTPGLFHLESNTEGTINDVEIAWAAKVIDMKPR